MKNAKNFYFYLDKKPIHILIINL